MKELCVYFGALSDATRLKIIQLLTEHEMCVCEIEDRISMSQPAISHHLRILKRAGLIASRKSGKWTYYSINGERFMEYIDKFNKTALSVIEDRVASGMPASPAQDGENSYCQSRDRNRSANRQAE